VQQRRQLHGRRNAAAADCQERAICIEPESERTNAGGIVERENVVEVPVGLGFENVAAHRPLDEDSGPAIRTAILKGPE